MNNIQENGKKKNHDTSPIAHFLVSIVGGVAGHDYATWLQVNPIIGAAIGGCIGLILYRFLYLLYLDPEGKIRETCSSIGALVGVIFGATTIASNSDSDMAWLIGALVGGGIGYGLGQMAFATISLGALVLLFLSSGPIGFMIRTAILNSN